MTALVRVIDDDPNVAEAIGELLASVGISFILHDSLEAFVAADDGAQEGCLILDVRLPGLSGLEFQRRSREQADALPIVFISGHGDIPMGVSAMKAGAIDFLPKPFSDQALLDAVALAVEEDRRRRAEGAERASASERYATLTPREREVLGAVVEGRRNREIAEALGLSEVTVKMHRGSVMRKMAAETVVDLVRTAAMVQRAAA